jgi:hypothetical protein
MLSGLLFDDAGQPMVATYATKNRVRYRYYMSAPLRRARSDEGVGSVSRVPAEEIEAIVGKAVRDHLPSNQTDQEAIRIHVERIEVWTGQLVVHLRAPANPGQLIPKRWSRSLISQGRMVTHPRQAESSPSPGPSRRRANSAR